MIEHDNQNDRLLAKERRFVPVLLLLICLVLAHFVHESWFVSNSQLDRGALNGGAPIYVLFRASPLPQHAPEAYRVAIPALGEFLVRVFHVQDRAWVAAALDFIFAFLAMNLFYRMAIYDLVFSKDRLLVTALFLAFLQFPLVWVIPWERPETLPTAFFLSFALFCLMNAKKGKIWWGLLLVATAFQAFVRADVPFVLGTSLVLMSFVGTTMEPFGLRWTTGFKGLSVVFIAGIVQAYLQLIRYPHLTYWPGNDLVQFRNNLLIHNFSNGALALSPFLVLAVFLFVKRIPLKGFDALVIASSALYLLMWFTVGLLAEVRIFVPFLMALSVVAAKVSASFLTGRISEG